MGVTPSCGDVDLYITGLNSLPAPAQQEQRDKGGTCERLVLHGKSSVLLHKPITFPSAFLFLFFFSFFFLF